MITTSCLKPRPINSTTCIRSLHDWQLFVITSDYRWNKTTPISKLFSSRLTTRRLREFISVWERICYCCFMWTIPVEVGGHTRVFVHIFSSYVLLVDIYVLLCIHPVGFSRRICIWLTEEFFGLTDIGFKMRSGQYLWRKIVWMKRINKSFLAKFTFA